MSLPELRETLAIRASNERIAEAAAEANRRTGWKLNATDAGAFARIVLDVINRGRT